jgi:hypothetical protein
MKWQHIVAPIGLCVAGLALAACSGSPAPTSAQRRAVQNILSTTTSNPPVQATTSIPTESTSTPATGIAVPDLVGQFITQVRSQLHAVGFKLLSINADCSKGNLDSQSVALSMELLGPPATPLNAGMLDPKGTTVGITWSGCYGKGVTVPEVVGLAFHAATNEIVQAGGLYWKCVSSDPTTPASDVPANIVTTQSPAPGSNVQTATYVTITMPVCLANISTS